MLSRSPTIVLALFGVLLASGGQQSVDAANILGVFTSPSTSHLIIHMSVMRALAEKGHNVTVVSYDTPKITHENIKVIVIPPSEEQLMNKNEQLSVMASQKNTVMSMIKNMVGGLWSMIEMQHDILKDPRFTALYEDRGNKFDVVFMGYFMNDYQIGVGAKFKCPVIMNWMSQSMEMVDKLIGNPSELAYVPNMHIPMKVGERMGFSKRLANVFSSLVFKAFRRYLDYHMEKFYNELYSDDKSMPSYWEMKKNISLLFCNSHFSDGAIRPNVPAIIEIGGIQIKDKPDPLPKDIGDFLNSSKDGAVLFSLGSNLKGDHIKPEIVALIFKVLSSLKQNVIWKWEDMSKTPGNSPNIMYKKWLPQDDILAHPKMKLFITHAGKGGIAEAQYHGVPMIAMPVFADQHGNAERMESSGYGLQLDMLQMTEADLKKALHEVIDNPVYAQNVQQFSRLYKDRPMSAKENVVYWTEYVIRHHGAAHMQSPLVHLNVMESTLLDVAVVCFMAIYILWRLVKLGMKFICAKLCKKSAAKKSGKKAKKQ